MALWEPPTTAGRRRSGSADQNAAWSRRGAAPRSESPSRRDSTAGLAAAAVGPGDDLQQVTVRVFEIQSAAAVPVVDHTRPGLARIGPVPKVLVADPAKGRVEFFLTDQEGVVLRRDLCGG